MFRQSLSKHILVSICCVFFFASTFFPFKFTDRQFFAVLPFNFSVQYCCCICRHRRHLLRSTDLVRTYTRETLLAFGKHEMMKRERKKNPTTSSQKAMLFNICIKVHINSHAESAFHSVGMQR